MSHAASVTLFNLETAENLLKKIHLADSSSYYVSPLETSGQQIQAKIEEIQAGTYLCSSYRLIVTSDTLDQVILEELIRPPIGGLNR